MICVTIAQESRRLALADLLNAALLGADLVEVRLDRFEKDANLSELVAARRTPILFSCKRPQDGGQWDGPEEDRLVLLRTAVISKAEYVEVELDAADHIRPFPGSKRVVSYTNLTETPTDIDAIYERLLTKKPDVVKLTCRAETPDEAWPLLQLLNKPPVPTVVVGLGDAGTLLALVGRKIGAPWASAALERGMEAYPGQPTVRDLTDLYAYREIGKKTRFVGVTGTDDRGRLTAGLLNVAFKHAALPHRALPVPMGNRKVFRKIADAVRLQGVLLDESNYEGLHEIARLEETAVSPVLAADALYPADDGWSAANLLGPAVVAAINSTLVERGSSLQGRTVLLAGCGPLTRMLAMQLKAGGASLIWASKNRNAVQAMSQTFGGRQLLWEAIYSTSHDVLVAGHDGTGEDGPTVHPGYLKPGMVVADVTAAGKPSELLREAAARGCGVVAPGLVLVEEVRAFARRLEIDVPADVLAQRLRGWRLDDA